MKIENFKEKLELEKITEEPIYSEPRIIMGYKMRLLVYLNEINGHGNHLSIYLQLMKGYLDECLQWPFIRTIEIALLHPENKDTHKLSLTLTTDDEYIECYEKPFSDTNEEIGYSKFIDHDSLHAKGFLKDDKLFIRCEIGQ